MPNSDAAEWAYLPCAGRDTGPLGRLGRRRRLGRVADQTPRGPSLHQISGRQVIKNNSRTNHSEASLHKLSGARVGNHGARSSRGGSGDALMRRRRRRCRGCAATAAGAATTRRNTHRRHFTHALLVFNKNRWKYAR